MTEFVLRLHCPKHWEPELLEFMVDAARLPRVTWEGELNWLELGDAGWGTTLEEASAHIRTTQPIRSQEVIAPTWRGPRREWMATQGLEYDDQRGIAHAPDVPGAGRYTDPDAERGVHLRYVIQCPRASCRYEGAVTRPTLLALLEWLRERRSRLAAEVGALQSAGRALNWRVSAHETHRDFAASVSPGEEYPPTPVLDADLDLLLALFPGRV